MRIAKQSLPIIVLVIISVILLTSCLLDSKDENNSNITKPDAYSQYRLINKTINLGNALEAPSEGEWGVVLKEEYFKLIKEAGFTGVRIPVRWSSHSQYTEPFIIDPVFLNRVNWAIDIAIENDLMVIMNMHHYEEIMIDPYAHKLRYYNLWSQISEFFKDKSNSLIFEILNEPTNQFSPELWNEFFPAVIDTIRRLNPDRTLICGGGNWNSIDGLLKLEIPKDDNNIIATFHYYNPFKFTHQGAEWVDNSSDWLGNTWTGTQSQINQIEQDFVQASMWSKKHNIPLYLGEFGAYNKADMESRRLWTEFVARTSEKYDISWGYWEFCSGFGIYDSQNNIWRTELLNALIQSN